MRKRIASLLLILALCFTLLPTSALAADSNKISITTVDELLQFAKAVDDGEYDDKTDAVVSLDADLDLTGVAWKPIGSVFDGDGNLLHYFSGKFYGNGHTISNLDFSENYGKAEYPVFGFFSVAYGAEISGLTIQGKLDVSNSGYVFFGTVAGVAENSKISDCVSDVSFTDTDKYINGPAALCGYAINSTIEHCQNKGIFSVTTNTTSLQMGGIVGVADNSTVQYCANTGDMTSWTPHTGGIVGQLYQGSKIINCYSTGKMVPLGHGTTNFGGIAGTVGAGTEIRHCYFAGEMDLSQYTATTPYKRLGGIAGGVSSDTPVFENNYFVQTENVPACFKYQDTHKHRRSLNVLVIGGSGAAKTRSFVLPNILTANTNYVITDPKSEVLLATGGYLKEQGYDVRVLNLVNLEQSDGYNPFRYLRDEKDVLKLVNNLIQSTTPKGSHESDPFWTKAETALLQAIILMLFQEAPEYEQNFSMVMRVLEYAEVREEDEGHVSPLDLLFESIERRKPDSVAVRQYKVFKLAAGKTAKSILVSTAVRLAPFNLPQIQALTDHDDMDLYTLGEKKVALYAVIPDNDNTFNFLVSLLYAQAFQALYYSADQIHHGPLPRHVRFVLDEFAAMPLPGFTRELATMRSRSISASVIIQNMAQIKELYKDSWETIPGNCDTILYLGGNESSTHKYVSEMLGKATIDTKTHGQTKGKSGSYSTNYQMSGRELLTPDEVRKLDNRYALLFIRGASPVMDEKYDLMHHPAISHSSLGGAAPYIHHGTKPPVYTGRPLLRVGGTEAIHPLKEEFH